MVYITICVFKFVIFPPLEKLPCLSICCVFQYPTDVILNLFFSIWGRFNSFPKWVHSPVTFKCQIFKRVAGTWEGSQICTHLKIVSRGYLIPQFIFYLLLGKFTMWPFVQVRTDCIDSLLQICRWQHLICNGRVPSKCCLCSWQRDTHLEIKALSWRQVVLLIRVVWLAATVFVWQNGVEVFTIM